LDSKRSITHHAQRSSTARALQPNKASPVILRSFGGQLALLAFTHPLAGKQIIKGTIEAGEDPITAALRELYEESGIAGANARRDLGIWQAGVWGQIWSFTLCDVTQPLPTQWTHYTTDGGGHTFDFFWQPLRAPLGDEWHPVFVGAINFIRARVR